jgi:hypothetical protein
MLLCPRLFCSFLIDASLSLALIDPDLPFFLFDCLFGFPPESKKKKSNG